MTVKRSKHDATTRGRQTPQLRLLLASRDGSQQLYNPVPSFILSSPPPALLFLIPLHPPHLFLCSAPVSLCLMDADMGLFWTMTRLVCTLAQTLMRVHENTNNGQCICEFCQRSNQVTICCVSVWCLLERVGVCWFFSHFSWAELLANTHSFVLFVSFWTGFLWASFSLLVHYCTAANLSTSVKH